MSNEELGIEHLHDLFQELSENLQARGLQAQLFVVGGAAMALAYDQPTRSRTRLAERRGQGVHAHNR